MRSNSSVGLKPSGPTSLVSLSICCLIPATRISKNSSRFELTMVRNLTRSISGCLWSCASSSTRRLNSSQLSSRLMKFFGSPKRSCAVWTTCGDATAIVCSSVCGVAWASAICQDGQSTANAQRGVSASGGDMLVSDVFRRSGVNGVLADVGSMVAYALKATADKDEVQVSTQLVRVLRHAIDEFVADCSVQVIQLLIASDDFTTKLDVLAHKGIHAVLEHRQCMFVHRLY